MHALNQRLMTSLAVAATISARMHCLEGSLHTCIHPRRHRAGRREVSEVREVTACRFLRQKKDDLAKMGDVGVGMPSS